MGETTLDVRRRLAEEGLAPSGQTLPDYVGVELAFMAHLAAREALNWDAGDREEAQRRLTQQESFVHDHLGAWLRLVHILQQKRSDLPPIDSNPKQAGLYYLFTDPGEIFP